MTTRLLKAAVVMALAASVTTMTLTGCAPTTPEKPGAISSPSADPVVRLPLADEVFNPAEWSAQARKDSAPLVLDDFVVIATDSGVTALDTKGKEKWQTAVAMLPDASRPAGSRTLIAVTPEVVALIDKGTLPKGTDPLASEKNGMQVTLLNVKDGEEIATQAIPGDTVKWATGLGFQITSNGEAEYVAFTPTGERIVPQDGNLPIATVGEHIIWGTPYTANMGVEAYAVAGVPLANATLAASDGREIVVLSSYDGKTTTTLWWNLATGTPLTLDASCPATLAPKTLTASSDGAFVAGDNAIADVKAGTVTCTGGGADQKPVLWWAVTDDGTAYGQTADANDTLVIGKGGEVTTHTIPAEAVMTRLAGFTSDGRAILFNRDTGIVNANPLK